VSEVEWGALRKRADDATKPAPAGDHVVEIKKCSWKLNSSGNPMYTIQGVITEGPAEGKAVFNNFNVTVDNDFALAKFFQHMDALGLTEQFFATGPSHDQVCQALIGRRAIFTLEIRQWMSQDRNGVTDVKPLTGPTAMTALTGVVTPPGMAPGSPVGVATTSGQPPRPPTPTIPTTAPNPTMPQPTTPQPPTPFDITPPSV
jgi:hypothetical protein